MIARSLGFMRRPRVKLPGEGFYHVVSRIGGKRFLLDDGEKRILLSLVRAAAVFSGVDLLSYALMDNHFHLLVRVRPRGSLSEGELRRRIRTLQGEGKSANLFAQWEKWKKNGSASRVREEQCRYLSRMGDLSQFVKTFKEAYTQSFNRRHGNTGTIWEGRFKSLVVEGSYRALMAVAGYIHLNPVRAKMVDTPEEAPFTAYGAAFAGDETARGGLVALVAQAYGRQTGWPEAQEACREVMEGALAPEEADGATLAVRTEEAAGASSAPQPLFRDWLRHRRTEFLHGGALGGEAFLQRVGNFFPQRRRRPRRDEQGFSPPATGLATARGVRRAS